MTSVTAPMITNTTVDPFPVAALAVLFDDGLDVPVPGDPLPPYWHLAACAAPAPTTALGPDGHPADGPVAAPPGLPRRMIAGGRLRIHLPVFVGEQLSRQTRVARSVSKQGRSGPLRFVTVASRWARSDGQLALVEEQDIVYRTPASRAEAVAPQPAAPAPPGPLLAPCGPLQAGFCADAVALQRFSAATSNPHRIHFDYPYVTSVEGYPGLVVHGPLLLLSVLELVRLDLPDRAVSAVSFLARGPVFADDAVLLAGEPKGADVLAFVACDSIGQMAMSCTVTLQPGGRPGSVQAGTLPPR